MVCHKEQFSLCYYSTSYICPLTQIVQRNGLGCHQYTDDTQLYLIMDGWTESTPDVLDKALQTVDGWLKQSRPKLNPSKMDVLYLSCGALESNIQLPALNEVPLVLMPRMKNLGLVPDTCLLMEAQGTAAARSAFYNLWLIWFPTSPPGTQLQWPMRWSLPESFMWGKP